MEDGKREREDRREGRRKKKALSASEKNNMVPAVARGPPAAFPGLVHATSACSLTRVTERSSFQMFQKAIPKTLSATFTI